MRWTRGQTSEDVEDRRAESGGRLSIPGGIRGLGLGGVLVLLVLSLVFKQDFFALLGGDAGTVPPAAGPAPQSSPQEERAYEFLHFVVRDVQATWDQEFAKEGRPYRHAKVVVFRDSYPSACGTADAATGPFYCPLDEKVYLDLGFYDDLRRRFGAPGEFAQAYVVAHEVGHHIQKQIGVADRVRGVQRSRPDQAKALSVRLELQADCLAGVWAHSTGQRNLLEGGDLESGLGAAAAVGDDRLQRMSTGRVNPETWTHGSSQQRASWFRRGYDSGRVSACDTFSP
ncbi:MAG TPA: neutral zinc metallopeptidase [Anaeromyxobacteraceae bacterium]|nr:neutral zinc metallopeptidase [Anaeromyxobacteraceae bacterium]